LSLEAHNRVWSTPNGKEAGLCRQQHDHKIKVQLAFIAMAIGALPVRSCLPQYFGPKNTGEDCELPDKKKNYNACCTTYSSIAPLRGDKPELTRRRSDLDQSGVQGRINKPQPQTDPFHYANHGQNLDKHIFMICHEIT